MRIAPKTSSDKVLINHRVLSKAVKAFPGLAPFLLPQQPAKEFIPAELVLADAVALNESFC